MPGWFLVEERLRLKNITYKHSFFIEIVWCKKIASNILSSIEISMWADAHYVRILFG